MPFIYPASVNSRRHGPSGYQTIDSFKPWLRDEFAFRCVYCLCRETWFPDGETSFGVDHLRAQVVAPHLIAAYDNLVYACNQCNAYKLSEEVPDPCVEPFGKHVLVESSGVARAMTQTGKRLIDVCRLNRPSIIAYRCEMRELLSMLKKYPVPKAQWLVKRYLGFPAHLPDLSVLRPPGGNHRPAGITDSFFARKRRGELPDTY